MIKRENQALKSRIAEMAPGAEGRLNAAIDGLQAQFSSQVAALQTSLRAMEDRVESMADSIMAESVANNPHQ